MTGRNDMARKEPRTPHWREANARIGLLPCCVLAGSHTVQAPSAGWVKMFKDEFGMTDADFVRPVSQGDEPVHLEAPAAIAPEHRAAIEAIVGAQNVSDDDFSRVKVRPRQDPRRESGSAGRQGDSCPGPGGAPARQTGRRRTRRLLRRAQDSGGSVRRGFGCRDGYPRRQGRRDVGHGHAHEQAAGHQRAQHDGGGATRTHRLGLRSAAQRRPEVVRHEPCVHLRVLPAVVRTGLGRWVDRRSGDRQASTYYGDAYDLVISQEYVTPVGPSGPGLPASATGPKVNDILKGNEGTFGVLVEATLKIFRYQPENTQRFAFMLPNWDAAVEFSRGGRPGRVRHARDSASPTPGRPSAAWRSRVRCGPGQHIPHQAWLQAVAALSVCGHRRRGEGLRQTCRVWVKRIAKDHGGMSLTGYAEKQWEHGRFPILSCAKTSSTSGMIIDTLETSVTWDNLAEVCTTVRDAGEEPTGHWCAQ